MTSPSIVAKTSNYHKATGIGLLGNAIIVEYGRPGVFLPVGWRTRRANIVSPWFSRWSPLIKFEWKLPVWNQVKWNRTPNRQTSLSPVCRFSSAGQTARESLRQSSIGGCLLNVRKEDFPAQPVTGRLRVRRRVSALSVRCAGRCKFSLFTSSVYWPEPIVATWKSCLAASTGPRGVRFQKCLSWFRCTTVVATMHFSCD